jgi:hypothetical protein
LGCFGFLVFLNVNLPCNCIYVAWYTVLEPGNCHPLLQSVKTQDKLLKPVWQDNTQNPQAYALPNTIAADASLSLEIIAEKCYICRLMQKPGTQPMIISTKAAGSTNKAIPGFSVFV